MVRDRHVIIRVVAPNLKIEVLYHGFHSQFYLHYGNPSPETGACSFTEKRHLLAHGFLAYLVDANPALGIKALRIGEDRGITLLGQSLTGNSHLYGQYVLLVMQHHMERNEIKCETHIFRNKYTIDDESTFRDDSW